MCKFCRAGFSSAQVSSALPACTVIRSSAFHVTTSTTFASRQSARDCPLKARGWARVGKEKDQLAHSSLSCRVVRYCATFAGQAASYTKLHLHCLNIQSMEPQHKLALQNTLEHLLASVKGSSADSKQLVADSKQQHTPVLDRGLEASHVNNKPTAFAGAGGYCI